MNAGKSLALLQVAHNYEEQGHKVLIFTPAIDDRYGKGQVASRLGVQREAITFDPETDFLLLATEAAAGSISCFLIDEAQFLSPMQVKALHQVAHLHNIPVIAYGIRTDFRGEPFPGSVMLLALADDIEELKTICKCGRKATMNLRIGADGMSLKDGPQVEIGGNGRYRQVCPRCFYKSTEIQETPETANIPPEPGCECEACAPNASFNVRMILCVKCGHKRCPHATNHENACTGSNEPGQTGSSYGGLASIEQ